MTLAMAWIRNIGDCEELVFCSDSRLRFGCAWDSGQKVFPLARGDCAVAFAGDTMFAYPFIHAAINAVTLHRGSSKRLVDLFVAKTVLLNAINAMLAQITDLAVGQTDFDEPDIRLIFGGYSWRKKRFAIWKFYFNPGEREFRSKEVVNWKGMGNNRRLIILGNPTASPSAQRRAARTKSTPYEKHEDVEALAKNALIKLFESRKIKDASGLDMEPLEVLRDLLKNNSSPYIGGTPQLVKVYQHLNAQPFGVRWPDSKGNVAVLGRLLPSAEKMHVPVLDLKTLQVERPEDALALETIDLSSNAG